MQSVHICPFVSINPDAAKTGILPRCQGKQRSVQPHPYRRGQWPGDPAHNPAGACGQRAGLNRNYQQFPPARGSWFPAH